ncbi:MAG: hypothetical protein JWR63_796 [Conexibacter sp.]|jgi:hypothetical protein|nr:hypothetical protein [Conexibacter sp.]
MPAPPSDHPAPPDRDPEAAGRLEVSVALQADAGAEELDDATCALRDELLDLDVDAVDRTRSAEPPPAGARAAEATMLAGLAVQVGQATLAAVIGTIRQWVGRGAGRSVKLTVAGDTLEVTNVSTGDQHELIAAFLARHPEGSSS